MGTLKASTQYGDWEGSASADDADKIDLRAWLMERKHVQDGEYILGATVYFGENHGGKVRGPHVQVTTMATGDYDTVKAALEATPDPLPVREFDVEISTEELIGLFKRLEVVLVRKGLGLQGRETKDFVKDVRR